MNRSINKANNIYLSLCRYTLTLQTHLKNNTYWCGKNLSCPKHLMVHFYQPEQTFPESLFWQAVSNSLKEMCFGMIKNEVTPSSISLEVYQGL